MLLSFLAVSFYLSVSLYQGDPVPVVISELKVVGE